MYRVEVFSDEHNDYITHSWHKNRRKKYDHVRVNLLCFN